MRKSFGWVMVVASFGLVHCGDETGTSSGGEDDGGPTISDDDGSGTGAGGSGPTCTTTAYEATVGAFCEKQLNPVPADPLCIYGGSDVADCVQRILGQAQSACNAGCVTQFDAWLGCVDAAPMICGSTEADQLCGVERGLLETCCGVCAASDL